MNKRGFVHPEVLIVILLLAIVGVIFYVVSQNSGSTLISQPSPTADNGLEGKEIVSKNNIHERISDSENIDGWKSYTGKDIPVKLDYPSNFSAGETGVEKIGSYRVEFNARDWKEIEGTGLWHFTINKSQKETPGYPLDHEPTGTYLLSNIEATYVELPEWLPDGPKYDIQPIVGLYFKNNGSLYEIRFTGVGDIHDETISQILSTFEFTNYGFSEVTKFKAIFPATLNPRDVDIYKGYEFYYPSSCTKTNSTVINCPTESGTASIAVGLGGRGYNDEFETIRDNELNTYSFGGVIISEHKIVGSDKLVSFYSIGKTPEIQKDGIFSIDLNATVDDIEEVRKIMHQILSTFKFIK